MPAARCDFVGTHHLVPSHRKYKIKILIKTISNLQFYSSPSARIKENGLGYIRICKKCSLPCILNRTLLRELGRERWKSGIADALVSRVPSKENMEGIPKVMVKNKLNARTQQL